MEKDKSGNSILYTNAKIYSLDDEGAIYSALWVKGSKVHKLFKDSVESTIMTDSEIEVIDLKGKTVLPGFIEGHGHFMGLGEYEVGLQLSECGSWEEVVEKTKQYERNWPDTNFIVGKGWHPSNWKEYPEQEVDGYPVHHLLSNAFPDKPIVLYHSSFHALMANGVAMEMAGIEDDTKNPDGGRIVRDSSGNATGIFEENAMGLITKIIPEVASEENEKNRLFARAAGKACLENGITTFVDAGIDFDQFEDYKNYTSDGTVEVRLWTMASGKELVREEFIQQLPYRDTTGHKLFCTGVKAFVDGALGSYGAWMIEPYRDNPDQQGQNVTELATLEKIGQKCIDLGMQYCVHAIGDRGNREMLDIFEHLFDKNKVVGKDLRWRMEHAQIVRKNDIKRFEELGVIPSMQAIHCPSDASFVIPRIGKDLAEEGAYAWRTFIESGSIIANGTDCPVERVNPFENIYASVTRKKQKSDQAFIPLQSMSREEAILSVTKWNAYACKLENNIGTLEEGKLADMIVLDRDVSQCPDEEISGTKVLMTIIGGKAVYSVPYWKN